MDLQFALSAITVGGLGAGFAAGVLSQVFKSSTDVQGTIRKRLTPAGWLALAISVVGLSGSIASELIRISMRHASEIQAQNELAQRNAMQEQEERWRQDMSALLGLAKQDIEKNLSDTIDGFQQSNKRFSDTQLQLLTSKQSLLEDSLQRTKQIIVASQPLISLTMRLRFVSDSTILLHDIEQAEAEEKLNGEDSQGGVPPVPFEVMRAQTVMALIAYLARVGFRPEEGNTPDQKNGPLMILPLDEAHNAVAWLGNFPGPREEPIEIERTDIFKYPPTGIGVARHRSQNKATYTLLWQIDSASLPARVDRRNDEMPLMSRMPPVVELIFLSDFPIAPLSKKNFAEPYAEDLWDTYNQEPFKIEQYASAITLELEVNAFKDMPYRYRLRRAFRRILTNYDESLGGNCLVLEFSSV